MSVNTSAYLAPKLQSLSKEVLATLPRVDSDDPEGVHDLRVALRRLRTLLRLSRDVFGRFHVDAIRGALRDVASATGELRDEEVLGETLSGLSLSEASRAGIESWMSHRGVKTRALRERVSESLQAGLLQRALAWLESLLSLPVPPEQDIEVSEFARRAARRAQRAVDDGSGVDPDDVVAMHDLRILYKRLRYALEGLEPALAPIVAEGANRAAKFQKRLGELHDIDVALETIRLARGLAPTVRGEVLTALADARERGVGRYLEEVAKQQAANAPAVPLAPASTPPPRQTPAPAPVDGASPASKPPKKASPKPRPAASTSVSKPTPRPRKTVVKEASETPGPTTPATPKTSPRSSKTRSR